MLPLACLKTFFTWVFERDFHGLWIFYWQILLQFFEDVASLSSCLHCFWKEICCHPTLCPTVFLRMWHVIFLWLYSWRTFFLSLLIICLSLINYYYYYFWCLVFVSLLGSVVLYFYQIWNFFSMLVHQIFFCFYLLL